MRAYIGHTHIGRNLVRTVVLKALFALPAIHAAPNRRADAHPVANLDVLHVASDAHRMAHDLVADNEGKFRVAPALLQGVQVGPTNAAVGDRYLDVVRREVLWLYGCNLKVQEIPGICRVAASASPQ